MHRKVKIQKVKQNFNLWLALIGLSGTGWDLLGARCRFFFSPFRFCSSMQINFLSWKGLHPAKSLYVINLVNSDVTIKLVKLFIWFGCFYIRPSLLLRRFVLRMAEASAKRVTGDEPQGTMGRVQTAGQARCLLPAFLCAHVWKRDVWVRGSIRPEPAK